MTTVFAATTGGPRGGYGVPTPIVRERAARGARGTGLAPGPVRADRCPPGDGGATLHAPMAKTLVIAEKPSVGRDLARVLPGPFAKHEGYLEGPEHVVTWAVGHLVQLAEPDEYDAEVQEVAHGRPADRARRLQARRARRALAQADDA